MMIQHLRDFIISELQRIAATNGGRAPGQRGFKLSTGINESEWLGVHWARWGDVLAEAGLTPNEWQERFDADAILTELAAAVRHYQKLPTKAELQIYRRTHAGFSSHKTFSSYFGLKNEILDRLRQWTLHKPEYADVLDILGEPSASPQLFERDENRPQRRRDMSISCDPAHILRWELYTLRNVSSQGGVYVRLVPREPLVSYQLSRDTTE